MSSEYLRPLLGGVLIGLASALLLLGNGRIAGVSGVAGRVWASATGDRAWRVAFVLGLVGGGGVLAWLTPQVFGAPPTAPALQLALAGLLVGVGTQLANGCTSGHGICGNARGSVRSLVATLTFMAVGILVVAVVRGRFGGA